MKLGSYILDDTFSFVTEIFAHLHNTVKLHNKHFNSTFMRILVHRYYFPIFERSACYLLYIYSKNAGSN